MSHMQSPFHRGLHTTPMQIPYQKSAIPGTNLHNTPSSFLGFASNLHPCLFSEGFAHNCHANPFQRGVHANPVGYTQFPHKQCLSGLNTAPNASLFSENFPCKPRGCMEPPCKPFSKGAFMQTLAVAHKPHSNTFSEGFAHNPLGLHA